MICNLRRTCRKLLKMCHNHDVLHHNLDSFFSELDLERETHGVRFVKKNKTNESDKKYISVLFVCFLL